MSNPTGDALLTEINALRERVVELEGIVVGFLQCPEIAECAPEDKASETDTLERRARSLGVS
ncbi:hypothetical protein [Bosea sp. PAMC 26642]|uniref:hypothetical protein n=1 Tax=Bosea sp. (strain PAMC 26642) TaxID=1792307 RepID=UPI000A7AA10E|nr:hypothetical protein [Bosea sp. PAMC 26642]